MVENVKTGAWHRAWQGRSDGAINAGKSPDGVLANLTHDKQVKIPMQGPVAAGGDIIHLLIKLDAADGLDVSDGVYSIAVTEDNGLERTLNETDFGISTDLPAATVAAAWVEIGTGYTCPQGVRLRIGSLTQTNPTVISVEDDTA